MTDKKTEDTKLTEDQKVDIMMKEKALLDNPKAKLYQKIAAVMSEVESVHKNGRNEYQHYDYATEADILMAIRGSLIKNKLLILPEVQRIDIDQNYLTTLIMIYQIVDVETGESIYQQWIGTGQDKGDKGAYKALTGANKYFLLKTFLIATNDDPENESSRKVDEPTSQANNVDDDGLTRETEPTVSGLPLKCYVCGAPAERKNGIGKSGKPYSGIFCTTKQSGHVQWL